MYYDGEKIPDRVARDPEAGEYSKLHDFSEEANFINQYLYPDLSDGKDPKAVVQKALRHYEMFSKRNPKHLKSVEQLKALDVSKITVKKKPDMLRCKCDVIV